MKRNFLTLDVADSYAALKGIASPVRIDILRLLHDKGPMNVNEISAALKLPQSSVATAVQMLEEAELIDTKTVKAKKGHQKLCSARYDEIVIRFDTASKTPDEETIEVSMPIGLYTSCDTRAPCGLCSSEGVIGLLDVPNFFLDPNRMQAGLIWFGRGYVEYKFPNNAKILNEAISAIEFSMELSSEVPGTNPVWPSDITLWVNNVAVGTWTSPGDFGDKRGVYTPRWWKLEGSQYGKLKTWTISARGTFIDGIRISDVTLADLDLENHHSIRMRIGIADEAKHPGGINIFGRGFGNYDQDIVMRLYRAPERA
ncbi:helix-turn-helix domain-containing protein [Kaistia dalseonensis]|uniref:Transcriptional regulator n=1 Tax=Kaistia dalseonensis TaxID=410840 RepID=A0ABU0H774_9HYPH|nr:helix-turn-helix domain-containing protein [Kaistia dalseonensis]MCX5495543.1 helix-turn-helix domain-containing protein [Kaistia dalseonensis]MDQ0438135.1 putative transcriptional regulator [Kaistia dalseonensis]